MRLSDVGVQEVLQKTLVVVHRDIWNLHRVEGEVREVEASAIREPEGFEQCDWVDGVFAFDDEKLLEIVVPEVILHG